MNFKWRRRGRQQHESTDDTVRHVSAAAETVRQKAEEVRKTTAELEIAASELVRRNAEVLAFGYVGPERRLRIGSYRGSNRRKP